MYQLIFYVFFLLVHKHWLAIKTSYIMGILWSAEKEVWVRTEWKVLHKEPATTQGTKVIPHFHSIASWWQKKLKTENDLPTPAYRQSLQYLVMRPFILKTCWYHLGRHLYRELKLLAVNPRKWWEHTGDQEQYWCGKCSFSQHFYIVWLDVDLSSVVARKWNGISSLPVDLWIEALSSWKYSRNRL